jgi:CDP-glycerol glycerophosphotransferase
MYEEFTVKFPSLQRVFWRYKDFDFLASVVNTNSSKLSLLCGIKPEKFVEIHNLIDEQKILALASEKLDTDIEQWLTDAICFAAFGRLSIEKCHERLIRAFSAIHAENVQTKLIILGDGPLKNKLLDLIRSLGLEKHVLLGGHRRNPFSLMRRADCIVQSSDHEGQPMVLLEALTLGKPIVATSLPSCCELFAMSGGLLVDISESGLLDGMRRYLHGDVHAGKFDVKRYNAESYTKFREMIFHQSK